MPGARALELAIGSLVTSKNNFRLILDETNVDYEMTKAFSDQVLAILKSPLSFVLECRYICIPLGPSTELSLSRTLTNHIKFPEKSFNLSHNDAAMQVVTAIHNYSEDLIFGERKTLEWHLFEIRNGDSRRVNLLSAVMKTNIFCSLETLTLSQSFPDDAEENGGLLTDLLPSIASHCPNLSNLDLSENNLGVPGACAVGTAFLSLVTNRNSKELKLNLSETDFGGEAATEFSDRVLAYSSDISNPLSCCEIDLRVDNNPLEHSGLLAIFRVILNKNYHVKTL